MKRPNVTWYITLSVGLLLLISVPSLHSQIQPPSDFFGRKIGDDGNIVTWPELVAFYEMLAKESERVNLQELGETSGGNPFLMVTISSEHNLKNLARIKNLQLQAANPAHLTDDDARQLARENVAVAAIILNATSDGIASTQVGAKLAYNLAATRDSAKLSMLDHVLIHIVPCMNPDGLQRVSDWYMRYRGTDHEASPLTRLSHPVAGDEYLLDWSGLNLPENRMVAREIYQTWFPEVVYEQREVRAQDARLRVLINPSNRHSAGPPESSAASAGFLAAIQQQRDLPGIAAWHTDWLPLDGALPGNASLHNQIAVLSLVANVNVASPLFFPRSSVPRAAPSQPLAETGSWDGGWWRQDDIVKYELASIQMMLRAVSEHRESLIYQFCRANLDDIEEGKQGFPYAYVIPAEQHDQSAAVRLLQLLQRQGVQIHQSTDDFVADRFSLKKGDSVILVAQAFGRFARHLLGPASSVLKGTSPSQAEATLPASSISRIPFLSGVRVVRIDAPISAALQMKLRIAPPLKKLGLMVNGDYLLRPESNAISSVVNRLLLHSKKVYWLQEPFDVNGISYPPGTVYLPANEVPAGRMDMLAREFSVDIRQVKGRFAGRKAIRLRLPRVGLLQPWRPTPDEGWTRFVLDEFEFDYETIFSPKVRNSDLRGDFDVVILPAMSANKIIHGWRRTRPKMYEPQVPRSYLGGISDRGVENLASFVRKGGTLIAFGEACRLAIEHFGLPVEEMQVSAAEEMNDEARLVQLRVDGDEPLAYGMPATVFGVIVNGPVLRPNAWQRRTGVAAVFSATGSSTASGRNVSDVAAGMSAVLSIPMGEGRVVLIGIRPQYRAQTLATFKFLFNGIFLGRSQERVL